MDGKVLTLDEVKTLAATPSKEVLIAKIMGSLNSPISSLARLLSTIVDNGVEIADLAANKANEEAPVEATVEEAKVEAPVEAKEEADSATTEEKTEE